MSCPTPIPLDAPLPQRRRYTLLDAAREITDPNPHWMGGAALIDYPPPPVYGFDPFGSGTYRAKASGGETAAPVLPPLTVYLPGVCTARSIGSSADSYKARLRLAFEAVETIAVERFLATGAGGEGNAEAKYLGDPNMEALNGGTAVGPVEGLALLEDAIAAVGNGMIHVAPATATYLATNGSIAPEAAGGIRQMRTTGSGTLVAVGAGYRDALPDAFQGTPASDREWAFASGFVEYRRTDTEVMPGDYSQALDRSQNEVVFLAERHYLLTWVGRQDSNDTAHVQAGVLIDRI